MTDDASLRHGLPILNFAHMASNNLLSSLKFKSRSLELNISVIEISVSVMFSKLGVDFGSVNRIRFGLELGLVTRNRPGYIVPPLVRAHSQFSSKN